jgi:hypothetical protein
MLRRVALVTAHFSEELSASFIIVPSSPILVTDLLVGRSFLFLFETSERKEVSSVQIRSLSNLLRS